jgi:hypothetical protein
MHCNAFVLLQVIAQESGLQQAAARVLKYCQSLAADGQQQQQQQREQDEQASPRSTVP